MKLLEKISQDLKLDLPYLNKIVNRSAYYYRDYFIKKKNGGLRLVSQPSPELKTLQYWVVHNIFVKLPVSNSACAYKKGDSIKKHANRHVKSRYICHSDIKNFFSSIHLAHLEPILRDYSTIINDLGLDLEDAISTIGKICFRNNSLCIGAVSSPIISNIIMKSFDDWMEAYCENHNYVYSRYADDIYFSSNNFIPKDVLLILCDELSKMSFELNETKCGFYSKKYRMKVTGLIITNQGKVSIGLKRRAEIKKMIYNKLVHNVGEPNKILGYLSFIKDIEPSTYDNLIIKYSHYCKGDIIEALNKE